MYKFNFANCEPLVTFLKNNQLDTPEIDVVKFLETLPNLDIPPEAHVFCELCSQNYVQFNRVVEKTRYFNHLLPFTLQVSEIGTDFIKYEPFKCTLSEYMNQNDLDRREIDKIREILLDNADTIDILGFGLSFNMAKIAVIGNSVDKIYKFIVDDSWAQKPSNFPEPPNMDCSFAIDFEMLMVKYSLKWQKKELEKFSKLG
jgi:hypothetical protein